MPYGLYMSAAGARAQSHRLEVLSHNLANVSTTGFKAQTSVLQARAAEAIEEGQKAEGTGGVDDIGGGVTIAPTQTSYTPGPTKQTGKPTDFAIQNPRDFFVIEHEGRQMLTRAGNFHFNVNGRLSTESGDPVLDVGGRLIQIDPRQDFQVQPGGRIGQNGGFVELMLARPSSMGDLSRRGSNLFLPLAEFGPVPAAERDVRSGHLEGSSVQPTAAMTELIDASRAYEANVKMIQNQDHVMGTLISRVLQS